MRNFFRKSAGFTLLEILAVLVILSIFSAVAVSRFSNAGADDVAAANTLKAHLRYAQLRAMGDIEPWGITLNGSSYTLFKIRDDVPVNVMLPGENGSTKSLENVTLGPAITITFSPALGRPDPNGYTITVGGRVIVISPETGFIQ